jgi:hypothetical protein
METAFEDDPTTAGPTATPATTLNVTLTLSMSMAMTWTGSVLRFSMAMVTLELDSVPELGEKVSSFSVFALVTLFTAGSNLSISALPNSHP